MSTGRVKWFNNQKGYGFIESAETHQDVFVHFSDIVMKGYKTLTENEVVFFVLNDSQRGPSAREVCPLSALSNDEEGQAATPDEGHPPPKLHQAHHRANGAPMR